MKARWDRIRSTGAWRVWQRYADARGNVLAAGIAYFSFFSLFPAFALAAVVFGFVLQGRPDLLAGVGDALNAALPGFVRTPANPAGLIELSAPETATLSWAGVVAFATLLLGGLGWIGSLREALRAVFGAGPGGGNPVLGKARDLAVLGFFGIALLLSAALTSIVGAAAAWGAERVGLADRPWLVGLGGVLVSFVVDSAIMVVLLRVLGGVALPWRVLRTGALLGGGAMTVLKLVGAQLIARATSNPLFGSVVVVVGLLFWLNLLAKVVLLSASWAAHDLTEAESTGTRGADPSVGPGVGPSSGDAAVRRDAMGIDAGDRRARVAHGIPDVGARNRDRVTLAAGAVLGGVAAVAVGSLARAWRALVPARRTHRD